MCANKFHQWNFVANIPSEECLEHLIQSYSKRIITYKLPNGDYYVSLATSNPEKDSNVISAHMRACFGINILSPISICSNGNMLLVFEKPECDALKPYDWKDTGSNMSFDDVIEAINDPRCHLALFYALDPDFEIC